MSSLAQQQEYRQLGEARIEEWRSVPGYEGAYEVSSLGRVRGVDRTTTRGQPLKGRVLVPRVTDRGYRYVTLCWAGRTEIEGVHRIVAAAFDVPGVGPMVLHANDIPGDDRPENLRFGTAAENNLDRVQNGHDHNLRKTACPYGHPLSEPNLVLASHGGRKCKACRYAHNARYRGRTNTPHGKLADAYLEVVMSGATGRIRLSDVDPGARS